MTIQPADAFCSGLIESLASHGVTHACVSPGSRNTPLLLAIAAQGGVEVSVHHDERSGAFFALGLAKATGRPTLLSCTSGTAATEYLPALTEGRMSHTPLIALTADRPPELHDRGSPQTINQTNLYGVAAKWFHDTGVPNADSVSNADHLARQAVATAIESPAGPVHLNIPLRDPLVPATRSPQEPPAERRLGPTTPPPVRRIVPDEIQVRRVAELVSGRTTVIVAGQSSSDGLGAAVGALARALRAIVIADPQAETRFAGNDDPALVSTADLLLAAGFTGAVAPEAIIHVGAIHTSKAVNQWLKRLQIDLIHIDDGQWHDPLGVATEVVVADPASTLLEVAKIVDAAPDRFAADWRRVDDAAMAALRDTLVGLSEPAIAHALLDTVPAGAVVVAGSSMPIRLIDSYGTRRSKPGRLIANRGANGIDGTIATALGVAMAGIGPTYALMGDLAALADAGSLATARRLRIPLTIVVINNDGGGIFRFLPQADPDRVDPEAFTNLIATPHGQRLVPIARAFGVDAYEVNDAASLRTALGERPDAPRLIEVITPNSGGPLDRARIVEAVVAATNGSSTD
ncbi:MAG: 2-succinyl-5-enolpyruvyl-6-hydroxy-3-cyclohexene-1-carboxylic-acid synthase [bacterium]|nr:2-succinyl-5-enolpyruvyl-6-hydroxy-3-cyclohexene-1-carboxylic-acid synthase [bacterium]